MMLENYFQSRSTKLALSTIGLTCLLIYPASAQVIPDNSLGSENSIVTPNVTVKDAVADFIEGGAVRGNNLFHSFEQFNVGEGSNVYFANPDGVTNILNRVTGNNASNIFGTLGVDGGANLFLLNPNGIVFGENAALDVSGSFVATTAESYIFENGFEYSAANSDTPPLLTIDLPIGVQLGNNPGSIAVRGTGHNLGINPFSTTLARESRSIGLEVESGKSLMLLGGEINLNGGNLTAPEGNVELGGVGATETVALNTGDNGLTFDYGEVSSFADINLTGAASIEVSGSGGGSIQIQGKNISVVENSAIIANTLGTDNAGNVDLVASESVKIINAEDNFSYILAQIEPGATGDGGSLTIDTEEVEISSGIISTLTSGTGDGGNITVESDRISLKDGGQIALGTYGAGNSGDLSLNAESIEIVGNGPLGNFSGLYSTVFSSDATGNGGNLTVESDRITIKDGGQISTGTLGTGNSGDLSVDAESIEIRGASPLGNPSGLLSSVLSSDATGNGGNITVNSRSMVLEDGGYIASGTVGIGNSGDLSVDAESIEIKGTSPINPSGLYSTVNSPEATGEGGNLTVNSRSMIIEDGGQIGSGTFGAGNSGDLIVNAEFLVIKEVSSQGNSSGLFSSVNLPEATGDGGNLTVNSRGIIIKDGGQISTATFGEGNSGDLTVNAESIEIKGASPSGDSSGLYSTVISPEATGDGGNLTLESDRIVIEDGGQISTGTLGTGKSGDLSIDAESIEIRGVSLINPSGLYSTVISPEATGDGGNLTLESDRIVIKDGGQISTNTLGAGNGGDLSVNAESIEIRGTSSLGNASGLSSTVVSSENIVGNSGGLSNTVSSPETTGNGGNLTVDSDRIVIEDGGLISTGTSSAGNSGDLNVNAESIEIRGSSPLNVSGLFSSVISPEATGDGGNLTVESNSIVLEDGGQIGSGTFGAGNSGDLNVNAESIEIRGVSSFSNYSSGLFSTVALAEARGDGGNLTLESDRIILEDGGLIGSGTYGAGDSGDLTVNAESIEIRGASPLKEASGLFSTVALTKATGDGGNLTLDSRSIILEDGGQIRSGTFGIGNSGDLSIKASESITINGINSSTDLEGEDEVVASGLFASVDATGTGDGGNLSVETPQLDILDGGQISVSTSGTGNGGNLIVESDGLQLLDGGEISASGFGSANAGNIRIQANDISISGILPDELVLNNNGKLSFSNISAFSEGEFAAGSIAIESNNLNLSDRGNISVSNSGMGDSGNLNITANELNLDRAATIEAKVNAGDRGNINLTTDKIVLNNRSQITAQATGTATGGNITIDNSNYVLARNNSNIKANAVFGAGGNISILSELVFIDLTSKIDASSEFGLDGVVSIKSPDSEKELSEVVLPEKIEDPTGLITAACPSSEENTLATTGNGGIPNSPYQTQSIDATWHDLRPVKQKQAQVAASPKPLTEANSTIVNANGELELVALTTLPVHRWINSSCSN